MYSYRNNPHTYAYTCTYTPIIYVYIHISVAILAQARFAICRISVVLFYLTGLSPLCHGRFSLRSRPKSYQMVRPCQLKFGSSFNSCRGNQCISFPPLAGWCSIWFSVLPTFLMASFSSLDARIVEFPVLIRDLPAWAFPLLTRSSSVVGAVLPGPDCWAVSAAWKHLSSRLLVWLLSDAGRSRLWT